MTQVQIKRPAARGARAASVRLTWRRAHLYLGVAIAPSVMFFAATGCLQLFSLHEAHGDYQPLPIVEKLGMFHKDQVFALKPRRPATPRASGESAIAPATAGPRSGVLALKVYFLAVGAGLLVTTGLGLWMAFTQGPRRPLLWWLLLAGCAIPLALAMI